MRERVEAMKAIWTKSKPEYHGEFVNFPPMMTWPKPVQKPHPPVIVGGAFPQARAGARRATATAGCRTRAGRPMATSLEALPEFREMLKEAGRADGRSCPITLFGVADDADLLKRYRDPGVVRSCVSLPAAKADEVLPILDRWPR